MSSTSNTTITHKEERILRDVGRYILVDLAKLTNFTLFYGAFLVVFCISVHMIIRRGLHSRVSWTIFAGAVVNFGVETAKWVILLVHLIFEIQIFHIHNGDLSLSARFDLVNKNDDRFLAIPKDIEQIPILISDAFVIWRAWALFADRRMIMSIPLALYLATVVTYLVGNSFNRRNEHIDNLFFLVNLILSLATNFITTLMIGWRLWIYRKHVAPNLGRNPSHVQRTFIILLESGAAYCILQLATLVNHVRPHDTSNGADGTSDTQMQQILYSFAAMYPSVIAILAHTGSSHLDDVGSSPFRETVHSRLAEMRASHSESSTPMPWNVAENLSRPSLYYDTFKSGSKNEVV